MVLSPSNSFSVASRCSRTGCPSLLDVIYGTVIRGYAQLRRGSSRKRNPKENRKVAYSL
jgi:hypothetical protein